MRYYSLEIRDPDGSVYQIEKNGLGFTKASAGQGATFSSLYTRWQTSSQQLIGTTNPSALNIEFDFAVSPWHTPQGGAVVRVWGLGIKCLGQAANLNPVNGVFKTFTLRAARSIEPCRTCVVAGRRPRSMCSRMRKRSAGWARRQARHWARHYRLNPPAPPPWHKGKTQRSSRDG